MILNLVLDARSRLAGAGRLEIRSAHEAGPEQTVAITLADQPRAGAPARPTGEGTQFGLATVGLIARDAGGEAELRPGPGGGSEVRVRLPARPGQSS